MSLPTAVVVGTAVCQRFERVWPMGCVGRESIHRSKSSLRAANRASGIRLREICKRMSLHVVEEEVTTAGYWRQVANKAVSTRQVLKKDQ